MDDSAAAEHNIGLIQVLTYGKKSMKKCRTEFKGNFKVTQSHIHLYRCDITEAKRRTCSRYGLASDRNSTSVGSYFLTLYLNEPSNGAINSNKMYSFDSI
jgi:hypothetical protein